MAQAGLQIELFIIIEVLFPYLFLIMASSSHASHAEGVRRGRRRNRQFPSPETVALDNINDIPMSFIIWSNGRREDSDGTKTLPVEQPAKILTNTNLFIGDIDDALDVENLKRLNIGAVVTVCSEQISTKYYWSLPSLLAEAGIDQLVLRADDSWYFDIIPVAERALVFIRSVLKDESTGVLVHCYGGVNRSGAVCAFYMAIELCIPLCEAVKHLREARGTVLTNQTFVKQLVHYCFLYGAELM